MRIPFGEEYGLPLGVNKEGYSANIQLAPYEKELEYSAEREKPAYVKDIIRQTLNGKLAPSEVPQFMKTHSMQYGPENISAHCMTACKDGSVCIAEPGKGCLSEKHFPDGFALFTNFFLMDHRPIGRDMTGILCRRYKTAYRMLLDSMDERTDTTAESSESMDDSSKSDGTFQSAGMVDRLFEILEAVCQRKGKMPTVFSMVAELDAGEIHFSLHGDYAKRFRFSFSDHCISTAKGFALPRRSVLTPSGISAEELKRWF